MTRVTQAYVDARREAILTAAARLFARKGISGATMAEIASEADLSAGAIYRYYRNKEELLRAVFDDAAARNQEILTRIERSEATPLRALQQLGHEIWVNETDRDAFICEIQMELSAARDPDDLGIDIKRSRDEAQTFLRDLVMRAQEHGELDASIDPDHLALILNACTSGIKMLKLTLDDNVDIEGTFNLFVRMVQGLAPSGE